MGKAGKVLARWLWVQLNWTAVGELLLLVRRSPTFTGHKPVLLVWHATQPKTCKAGFVISILKSRTLRLRIVTTLAGDCRALSAEPE